jgi:cell division transport system permease protein
MDSADWRRLKTGIRAGIRSVRTAPVVFIAAVTVMTAGLTVFGVFLLGIVNMRSTAERLGEGFSVIAFLAPAAVLDMGQVDELMRQLERIDGVAGVEYVTREQALERLREGLGKEASVLEGLSENPLPASFELRLAADARSPEKVRAVVSAAKATTGIEDVQYGEEWVGLYARGLKILQTVGLVVGLLVFLVLSVIVGGTLRLVVDLSAEEIQIQRLVGAGGLYVRLPFYVQGALQGFCGALASLAILYALFRLDVPFLGPPLQFLTGGVTPSFFDVSENLLWVVMGVVLGLSGAVVWLLRLEEA